MQAAHAGRAVAAVAGMAAERLGHAHDHVARLGQRGVDGHVADHAGHQPVVGVAGPEHALEQLDAQRLDLVDVPRAGEPAVDRADMALGGARADLGGQQARAPSGWSGASGASRLRHCAPAPFLVARDRAPAPPPASRAGEAQASRTARAWARIAGSWTSNAALGSFWRLHRISPYFVRRPAGIGASGRSSDATISWPSVSQFSSTSPAASPAAPRAARRQDSRVLLRRSGGPPANQTGRTPAAAPWA